MLRFLLAFLFEVALNSTPADRNNIIVFYFCMLTGFCVSTKYVRVSVKHCSVHSCFGGWAGEFF